MIPSALIAHLKMLAESTIQSTEPIRPLRPDPPPYNPGDRIRAVIRATQPDGTYRADVAGRPLTLSLPAAAKPGDQLDLIVTGRIGDVANGAEPVTVTARMAGFDAAATASPQLSRTAVLIGNLLTGAQPKPVPLAQGTALLPQPSGDATHLAPALREAVSSSGVFYEAHQANWIEGRSTLAALLREPQAKLPPGSKLAVPTKDEMPASGRSSVSAAAPAALGSATAASIEPQPGHEVSTIVQKQLDTLATQQLSWQVQIWPGQQLDWEIDAPFEREAGDTHASEAAWRTRLRLVLPRLGALSAELAIGGNRVSIKLRAHDADVATQLALARPQLAGALAAAGLQLTQASVDRHG